MVTRREFLVGAGTLLAASGVPVKLWSQASATASLGNGAVLFGADYYPDQTPESLWEEDARLMADFGCTNVRIAEFAWSLMEPSEGHFDFAWLNRVVAILHAHNIGVILGTPSAAPPPWLTQKYPDVLMVNEHGLTLSPEGRRFTCPSNKVYRGLSLTIATQMAKAFTANPGVIGWQIDNEFTLQPFGRCYCHNCRAGFQDWVRTKYGSLDHVNQVWGTAFWSQVYTDFSQIPVPLPSNGDPNPGLALDYDRYQSYANASSLEEQLAMLRQVCPRHFVTTNSVGLPFETIDTRELFRNLDFVSNDNYPGFISVYFNSGSADGRGALQAEAVASMVSMGHDSMRSVKHGAPFLIMEQQSGKAGQKFFSPQPYPGQLRLWSYQAVAHGAMGINYFRWDTANFGAEEYWHGLLQHDRSKSPGFEEIRRTIAEFKTLGPDLLHAAYVAELALCFDYSSDWAMQIQPGQRALSYAAHASSWYGALSSSHAGIDIVAPDDDLSRYRAVFAPVPYVVGEKQAASIRNYVQSGGLFVTSFRLGTKTEGSQIVRTPLPGLLRDVMGVTVEDYVPLYDQNVGVKFSGLLAGADGRCQLWADVLKPEHATVLGTYSWDGYDGMPAITSNEFGKGRAVYLGGDLDVPSLARVLNLLVRSANVAVPFEVPRGVEVTRRKSTGVEWTFLLNHASTPQSVVLPDSFRDALTGASLSGKVDLAAYDARVLRSA
jgi:beta-galactosidase